MKKLFYFLAAFFISISLKAQDKYKVQAGTLIQLICTQSISTKEELSEGQLVSFQIANDIVVDDSVILKSGTQVNGVIKEFENKRAIGRPGYIRISIDYLRLKNGTNIPLQGGVISITGKNKMGKSIGLACGLGLFVAPPFFAFLAMKGGDAHLEVGHSVNCVTL